MSLASTSGLDGPKIRYAVVGLGDIAQSAMMPGVRHTGNSTITALVSGDPEKLRVLGERYSVDHLRSYDEFPALIASGQIDAVYLATPNWRHAEFAVPALEAGIHVLCEKPLEVTSQKCRDIIEAAERGGARLMTAYRLHFEPATLDAIRRIRAGEIGQPIAFSACFLQMLDPENHRAHNGILAGPLFDMGPYPINAIRYLFGSNPIEVISATAIRHPGAGLGDIDDTVAVMLRMPGDAVAQFTVGYVGNAIDTLTIAGTKGSIRMDPAFGFGTGLEQYRKTGDTKEHQIFKATNQFGGEMKFFSDAILNDSSVEANGAEGLADLLVIEAILEALDSGGPVAIKSADILQPIDPDGQEQRLSPTGAPESVNASSPTKD